jgi:hypothetical protein
MSEPITNISDDIQRRINSPSRELTHGKLLVSARIAKEGQKPPYSNCRHSNSPVLSGPHRSVSHFHGSIIYYILLLVVVVVVVILLLIQGNS